MRRRLFTFVSVGSLLLCAAAVALWVRSYIVADTLEWGNVTAVGASRGSFAWGSYHLLGYKDREGFRHGWTKPQNILQGLAAGSQGNGFIGPHLGFAYCSVSGTDSYDVVVVPAWLIVGTTAVLPALWLAATYRRSRRVRDGQNLSNAYGYDLRASIDRCPECGTPIRAEVIA
jgi:hypothetical protein